MVFFFKQKTSYEILISCWSSDVCSSDLRHAASPDRNGYLRAAPGERSKGNDMADHVRITKSDGILQLVSDRADKKNALTGAMYGALADAFAASGSDRDVRVILIAGEGGMYTVGHDVRDVASSGARGWPPT